MTIDHEYTVTVTAKGGAWRGQRRKYEINVLAPSKDAACDAAMDIAEKTLRGDYDSLRATAKLKKS